MKLLACTLPFALLAASTLLAQVKPVPPGVRQADQTEAQTQQNIPPPANPHIRLDLGKLRQNADELARIAQTIPSDVSSIQKGILPKDVIQKLKQIEKLSKQLRGALNP
jgi:hypothetical protein